MTTLIIIASVALLIIIVCFFAITRDDVEDFVTGVGVIGIIFSFIILVVMLICMLGYIASSKEAQFLNKTYGTSYTAEDVLWNGETIKQSIIGKTQNLNVKVSDKEN